MNDALALVFDVGTQSVRAMLFDAAGHIVRSAQDIYEQPYYSRNPNWAEQRPDFYFEHICIVSQRLKDQSPEDFARAASVAVTVFRDTTVCMGKDGRPLRDCILWMDQRRAENPKPLPAERRAIFALAGMTETVEMLHRTSACNWIAENEPELWKKTDKYVCLSTYLNYRFTGRIADSSASLMAKIPYDYKNRKWDKNGLTRCVYDIPQDKLCEILPSGSVVGGVTPEASRLTGIPAGLPMLATGSDKGCETIGLSVIREDQAALSFGTSCTVQFTTRKYFEPTPFMPAYPAVPNDMYNPEIQILRGYWMLTWFKQNFAQAEVEAAKALGCSAEEILNKHLGDIPAGSDGLLVLPHWTPGLSTPNTRGAMIGFTDHHTKYHMYRAIIEGLKDGAIDIIATDHAPHSAEEKAKPFAEAPSGIIGLETALALGITNLVRKGHLTLMQLIEKMSLNPAKLYKLDKGAITEGADADLVIFNEGERWHVGPKFVSKAANTPFAGEDLYGKVKYTICAGNVVYEDGE